MGPGGKWGRGRMSLSGKMGLINIFLRNLLDTKWIVKLKFKKKHDERIKWALG